MSFNVETFRRSIEDYLDRYCQFASGCPNELESAIRYSLLSPGKRIRPLLVLMATRACGGDPEQAMPAACAVEMIHTYSLVHDDLPAMDDDDLRRGQPSCHVKFGEATAILVGDALIPLAFETLSRELPVEVAAPCCQALAIAAGATQLVGGQADDLASQAGDLELLQKIHGRKTAALLTASLKLGGLVAQASEAQIDALETFGRHLGLAFQIVDDLLDCNGDWTKMGKMANKDHIHGKMTYPGLLGIETSQKMAHDLIDQAIAALSDFDNSANPLRELARFVLERNQ